MKKVVILAFLLISTCSYGQLLEISDEFNRTCNLMNWESVNETEGWDASHVENHDINITNEGFFTLEPWTTAWYQDYRSNLFYKEVGGDFVFTTYVAATNKAGDNVPGSAYSLAGSMIRSPKSMTNGASDWVSGEENYVFLSLGHANGSSNLAQFEVKNTTNSSSSLNVTTIDTVAAMIRIAKIDAAIIVLYQLPNGDMTIRQRYSRPDMPDTVQVGLVTYTDWNKVNTYTPIFHNSNTLNATLDPDPSNNPSQPFDPDIISRFDYARYEAFTVPSGFEGLDFANPSEVSDADLLTIFSYPSTSNDLQNWKIWNGSTDDWTDGDNWSGGTAPTSQDSILIPNCGCDEVVYPLINTGSYSYASIKIEAGGSITIDPNSTLSIDLNGSQGRFINQGTIHNSGYIIITNSIGKEVITEGLIECHLNGVFQIFE